MWCVKCNKDVAQRTGKVHLGQCQGALLPSRPGGTDKLDGPQAFELLSGHQYSGGGAAAPQAAVTKPRPDASSARPRGSQAATPVASVTASDGQKPPTDGRVQATPKQSPQQARAAVLMQQTEASLGQLDAKADAEAIGKIRQAIDAAMGDGSGPDLARLEKCLAVAQALATKADEARRCADEEARQRAEEEEARQHAETQRLQQQARAAELKQQVEACLGRLDAKAHAEAIGKIRQAIDEAMGDGSAPDLARLNKCLTVAQTLATKADDVRRLAAEAEAEAQRLRAEEEARQRAEEEARQRAETQRLQQQARAAELKQQVEACLGRLDVNADAESIGRVRAVMASAMGDGSAPDFARLEKCLAAAQNLAATADEARRVAAEEVARQRAEAQRREEQSRVAELQQQTEACLGRLDAKADAANIGKIRQAVAQALGDGSAPNVAGLERCLAVAQGVVAKADEARRLAAEAEAQRRRAEEEARQRAEAQRRERQVLTAELKQQIEACVARFEAATEASVIATIGQVVEQAIGDGSAPDLERLRQLLEMVESKAAQADEARRLAAEAEAERQRAEEEAALRRAEEEEAGRLAEEEARQQLEAQQRQALEAAEAAAASFRAFRADSRPVVGHRPKDLETWNTEESGYVAARNSRRWSDAIEHLARADAVARVILADMDAYAEYRSVASDGAKAEMQLGVAAYQAGEGSRRSQSRFKLAHEQWKAALDQDKWSDATAAFRRLLTVARALCDDAAYLAELKVGEREIAEAEKLAAYPPVPGTPAAREYDRYVAARSEMEQAAQRDDFVRAKDCVTMVHSAAEAFVTAMQASGSDEQGAFDLSWKAIEPKLQQARQIRAASKATVPALEPAWRNLMAAEAAVDEAKVAGHWARARAALRGLQDAAARLMTIHEDGVAFDTTYRGMKPAIDQAASIVAEGLPHLAAESKAFAELNRATQSQIGAGRFAEAGARLADLERLAKVLIARDAQLGAKTSPKGQRMRKLLAEAKVLQDQVAEPARGIEPAARQPVLRSCEACIALLSGASPNPDAAAAELDKARRLLADAEVAREREWVAYYDGVIAAVEIEEAQQGGQAPDGDLLALRDKVLAQRKVSIEKAAGKKHFGAATAKAAQLLDEARAWREAKQTYDALDPDAEFLPDVRKLKALVARAGGAQVLDAIVEARTSANKIGADVVNVALEARFGFKAQRFDQRRAGGTGAEEDNAEALPAAFADKSITQTYKVLAKVPQQQWTAKVDAMIVYDKNDNEKSVGGHFARQNGKRKIYMYCGRPDDGNRQTFGKDQKVLPDGEEIEESCRPIDEGAVPLFDFTLLHEAGHAEDDARTYMNQHGGSADHGGWKSHAGPEDFVDEVAKHFDYDRDYILAMLRSPNSTPPAQPAQAPKGRDPVSWEKARADAVAWCRSVRTAAQPWEDAALSRAVAIQGRVYQEAYKGDWVSYDLAARSRGISSYQFRAAGEWFAELYAAYFSKKLKSSHPSTKWLKTFKSAAARA